MKDLESYLLYTTLSSQNLLKSTHPWAIVQWELSFYVQYCVRLYKISHMKKQQLAKFKSHMEKQQIEKLEREKLERQRIEELERQQIEELARQHTEELERQQNEKFQRYAVEGRRYLMSKYFSDKTIFGGDIFEVKTTKDGETTKMSRFPGYQSYADPANFNDDSSSKSNSTGKIFDRKKTKDGETTKVTRFPGSPSHTDPANSDDDDNSSESIAF